jgi:hypothetical protein
VVIGVLQLLQHLHRRHRFGGFLAIPMALKVGRRDGRRASYVALAINARAASSAIMINAVGRAEAAVAWQWSVKALMAMAATGQPSAFGSLPCGSRHSQVDTHVVCGASAHTHPFHKFGGRWIAPDRSVRLGHALERA